MKLRNRMLKRLGTSVGFSRFGQSSGIWKVKRVSISEEMTESEPPWALRSSHHEGIIPNDHALRREISLNESRLFNCLLSGPNAVTDLVLDTECPSWGRAATGHSGCCKTIFTDGTQSSADDPTRSRAEVAAAPGVFRRHVSGRHQKST
jgi:hypothetical protein